MHKFNTSPTLAKSLLSTSKRGRKKIPSPPPISCRSKRGTTSATSANKDKNTSAGKHKDNRSTDTSPLKSRTRNRSPLRAGNNQKDQIGTTTTDDKRNQGAPRYFY